MPPPERLSRLNNFGVLLLGVGIGALLLSFTLNTRGYGDPADNLDKIANKLVVAILGLTLSLIGAVFFAARGADR